MTVFRLVEREKASLPVRAMCRVLGVSPSGYYAWSGRDPSVRSVADAALTGQIRRAHARGRGTYGSPRVHAELREAGVHVGRKRIARLMRADGLAGISRRRFVRTTVRDRDAAPAPDLVDRQFARDALDRLWVADITYLPTRSGFCYLAAITDACSRRVVGWSLAGHLRTELITAALDMAVARRRPNARLVYWADSIGRRNTSTGRCCNGRSRAAVGDPDGARPDLVARQAIDRAA